MTPEMATDTTDTTDTTDALLEDPGDLSDEAATAAGGPETLTRMTAIYAVLREVGLALAPEGSVQREAQVRGIAILLDADQTGRARAALDLMQTITEDAALVGQCADAIVDNLIAVDDGTAGVRVTDDEPPVHRAVCMVDGCPCAITYRPTVSGGGFFILTREGMDLETTVGIGENGRPVCPLGDHGEMTLADETIPAAEAFAQASEKLARPVQADLPGIGFDFNFRGCYLELEQKASEVEALHEDYLEKAEEARDAKKAWDKAAELYTKMALEFKRRRQAKGDDDAPTKADPPSPLLACTYSQAHPEDICPLCADLAPRDMIVRLLGAEILPKTALGHADQVRDYRERLDVQHTREAIEGFIFDVPLTAIIDMTPETRAAVRAWAAAGAQIKHLPEQAGRPHVAGTPGENGQGCAVCGVVVAAYDDIAEALPAGAFVRLDCAGAQPEGHRYPERRKRAARAKPEPKATKPKAAKRKGGR